jgi:RimJ/RimL family protein N-acetyltransferase
VNFFVPPDRIETPSFTIRSYEPGDGALLSEATTSSYEHLRTFMAWATPQQSIDVSERLCRQWRGRYLLAEEFVLGIFSPAGDRLLGGTGFHLRGHDLSDETAEIGMWVRGDAAGQGLGTRALVTMLGWGFAQWPWVRITWLCDTRNLASARTAEKAGMRKEGCLRQSEVAVDSDERRDTFIFAALRDEWGPPAGF